ncbi:apolipoprotein F-like [Orycteropus afer afer]|uniref:Apolipoprotein F-like n=1 Tax=Orycteropus afer afer TaxID=1230840 RepID=A0A8B7B3T2_ORYAF|nr:apolipoprotein F-like [Orycteropus afer afer]
MMQAVLLCCVLLLPVAAFPRSAHNRALTFQPSFPEPGPPPNMLSSQVPLPDARSCQDLLREAPSLAPLPEYLSNLALRVALEEVGCPTEAYILQHQQFRMEGKDITETLIREIQKLNEEERIDHAELILRHLEGSPGELGRPRRSANLPEACTHGRGRLLHDIAALMVEFAEKLPATELTTELKTSAISVTQNCTDEAWEHVEAVGKQLMKSPEINNVSMSTEDQLYFLIRSIALLKFFLMELIQNFFLTYFR